MLSVYLIRREKERKRDVRKRSKNDTRRENFAYREGDPCTQKPAEIFEKSPPAEKARCKAAGGRCRCRSVAGSCGIRRCELRLAHQNRHKFFACNRFMLVQVFSDFMKLGQVILQKLDRFLVLRFYKVDGQGIDLGLCLG